MMYDVERVRENAKFHIFLCDDTINKVLYMYEEGYIIKDIEDSTGLDDNIIIKIAKAYGFKNKRNKFKLVEEAYDLVCNGMSVTDACRVVGIGRKTFYYYYKNKKGEHRNV